MVFRVDKTKNYTVMSNYHLREKEMSLKAKGLLSWMLSNTDDWDYSIEGIVANCKENRTAIKTALQELVSFGYLEINKLMPESIVEDDGEKQVIRGRIEYEYIVHEQPIGTPSVDIEIQDTENQYVENHTQRKTKESNTKEVNKNTSKEVLQNFSFGNKQKPKKDNLYTKCVQLIDSYDFSCWGHIREQLIDYLNFRLSVKDKPLYTNMWKGMLNKLANLCVDDISKYEQVIQYSLERGYLSFYEPSNYSSAKSKPWESGVKSTTRTEEEKEADREFLAKMAAQGKKVVF